MSSMRRYGLGAALAGLLFSGCTSVVLAGEKPEWRGWPLGKRFEFSAGYYRPKLDTTIGLSDSTGTLEATISFEKELGLSENKGTAIAYVDWRISKRNSVRLSYFELDRSSNQNSGVTIRFGDTTFDADFPIASFFDIEAIDFTYAYSFVFTEKHNLGLGIGLALENLHFGIQGTEDCGLANCGVIREQYDTTAPLPTFKVIYQYAINDKWIIDTSIGYIAVELDLDSNEDLGGDVWNASAAIRWRTWDNVGFTLAYKLFDVNVDYNKRDLVAVADYEYRGFLIGVDAYF